MSTVAERLVTGVLTTAQPHFFALLDSHLNRSKFGVLMGAVAKWLLGRLTAAAPPILAGFKVHAER